LGRLDFLPIVKRKKRGGNPAGALCLFVVADDVVPILRSLIVLAVGWPASSPSRLRRSLREA
jgi:hypothetical protein